MPRPPRASDAPPFGPSWLPLPTGEESAAFDAWAMDELGVPQPVLMENAGRAAAELLQHLHPRGRVVGLVGAGNNGGDCMVLLRTLKAWGRDVVAVRAAPREDLKGPAPSLAHGWGLEVRDDRAMDGDAFAQLVDRAVVVDGILGTGIRGAPRERQARLIRWLGASEAPVLALDIASGVDAATGAVAGEAVQADTTVSFGAPKLGCLLAPGRIRCGRVVSVEMGFPPLEGLEHGAFAVTPAWAAGRIPVRDPDTHKNAVGRLVVVAGGRGMAGAAVLATRAGFRAGAGLVQVVSHPDNRTILQGAVPEAIFLDAADEAALASALSDADAVAAGPGLGTDAWATELMEKALDGSSGVGTVLDADALNLVAAGALPAPKALGEDRPLLLTPHPGEMRRLAEGLELGSLPDDAVGRVRAAAEAWGCAVLLKGAPSVVAAPGEPVAVSLDGSSDLAVAGMGDVLTGTSGAALAQIRGRPLAARDAGALALHWTGRAAARAGRGAALTPSDVLRGLQEARGERGGGATDLPMPFVTFDLAAPR